MAEEKSCGPSAVAKYHDYKKETYYSGNSNRTRYRYVIEITGTGRVDSIETRNSPDCRHDIIVHEGITELADECFSKYYVDVIKLPKSLKKIGNKCFASTDITSIELHEGLEEIGEFNFPNSLTLVNIPDSLKFFPITNIGRSKVSTLKLTENHENYALVNGVLYNKEKTEILYCPRDKNQSFTIPNGVKRIGDYCFNSVKEMPVVIIPPTVTEIGKYALAHLNLKRLTIPNTITSVGEGCFYYTKVEGEFQFSRNVTVLPDDCFNNATQPKTDFIRNIQRFGKSCLSWNDSQQHNKGILRLEKAEFIDVEAFKYNKNYSCIEIYPCLKYIGKNAFDFEWGRKGVTVRCLSYAPPALNDDAFMELKEPILLVPEGTKSVYSQSGVWGAFVRIEEVPASKEGSADTLVDASPEIYKRHLKGLYESLSDVDRDFVSATLVNQLMNCTVVDNDESYQELTALLAYNRMFTPPIIADYEQMVEVSMTDEFKLKLVEDGLKKPYLLNIGNRQRRALCPSNRTEFPEMGMNALPALGLENTVALTASSEVEAHFNDIQKIIENELEKAQAQVRIAVSWFTNYRLMQVVKGLAERGVQVELVINNDAINNGGYCLDFGELLSAGVDMCLVEWPDMIHHKFCVIDGYTVITGSYNWTRFSAKNYENIAVIRDEMVAASYETEFALLQERAKYRHIQVMPDAVPPRAEYDRHAFKQYVTEDLDAAAREISDQRDKITTLHRAVKLNGEYMKKLAPTIESDYQEEFRILDMQDETAHSIVEMIEKTEGKTKAEAVACTGNSATAKEQPASPGDSHGPVAVTEEKGGVGVPCSGTATAASASDVTRTNESASAGDAMPVTATSAVKQAMDRIAASQLYMAVDVSGSMQNTFTNGHVKRIVEKALSAALTIAEDKGISLWTFGDTACEMGQVTLGDMSAVNRLSCQNSGTQLNSFVHCINATLPDGALVLVLTDDDGSSIRGCLDTIRQRTKVYWQFLSYDRNCKAIESALNGLANASLVYVSDYETQGEKLLSEAMLKGYCTFKIRG